MSYSISNNATVDGLSESSPSTLAQELANNTRVIAPPPSTATQDANDSRVLQGIGARDLSAMTLGTSLTVNSDTLQQLQLRNQVATTFTGGGNIIRFSNASITQETGLTANPATAPGGETLNAFFGNAQVPANQWEADFTEAVAGTLVTTPGVFTASIVANRNIWDPTFQFSVAAGGITYRVKTENPGDGIDYVNVRNGTAAAGAAAPAVDQIVTAELNLNAGVVTLGVGAGGSVDDYLGRQILGIIIEGTQNDTLQMTAAGAALGPAHTLTGGADTLNGAPSGIYVGAVNVAAPTVTLRTRDNDDITFTSTGGNMTLTFIMGARFAVSDADGNDAVPSAPLVNGPIVFLQDQNAIAHYLDFGRDTALNAQRLHDAIFGNSHGRTESKSQLLSLSDLAANPGVDLFVGTSTADPITEVVSPAAVNSAGVHVVFLTDLGQATLAGGNGNTTGRCANVQLIDSQDNTNFEVKLLAEWLADGSTTAGDTAGTFPRMQFTRFQDGMTSPTN
jgi:hypothetical protein